MTYLDLNTIHNPSPGFPPPSGWGDQVRDDLEWLARPITCRVKRTTAQSIPNAAPTVISWSSEDYDSSAGSTLWVPGAPTNFTIPVAGVWQCIFNCHFAINGTGQRQFFWYVGGSLQAAVTLNAQASTFSSGLVTCENRYAAGAVLTAGVYQNCGAALNLDTSYETWAIIRMVSL